KPSRPKHVNGKYVIKTHDELKNSVLGLSLLTTQKHNIKNEYSNCVGYDGKSRRVANYYLYNGTKLPPASGVLTHAETNS
ncbi:hypothetical protein NL533_35240, partial [Klebsiella pneumoniae]|nr:hypothetical protein [Klebsiella pneumoniae]